ncbi:hypothetical protein [Nocardiopsis synnemataformans]|uniref:hypothetical protein n=1 Tax=Nocardiopsis synnemataformans TaxID=61305 RepID=UPI003EB9FCC5
MPGHEAGVNPYDAYGIGSNAEAYASGFIGLGEDFNEVLLSAKSACAPDPQVTGWSAYGEEQAEAMAKVENHGVSLAENVQAGASEAAATDHSSAEDFVPVDSPLSRPPNL